MGTQKYQKTFRRPRFIWPRFITKLLFYDGYFSQYPDSGEWEMTFQTALRGLDGTILASDKQTAVLGNWRVPPANHYQIRWLAKGRKVQISAKHNVTIAIAGSDLATIAADILLEKLDGRRTLPDDLTPVFKVVGNEAYRIYFGDVAPQIPMAQQKAMSTLLIVAPEHKGNPIFRLDIMHRSFPHRFDNKAFAGDGANPAVFFVERYYNENALRPVSELRLLAAHTVLMGSKLNNGISGLEMFICRDGQRPEPVLDADISALTSRSEHLEAQIVQALL